MSTNKLAKVFHVDLYGKREEKYNFLNENSLATIPWKTLEPKAPNHFFVNKDFDELKEYEKGFSVNELFPLNNVGIVTARDGFTIHNSKQEVENTITEFLNLNDEVARIKYNLGKDVRDWQVNFARKDLENFYPSKGKFVKVSYRPFDNKWTYYTGKSKGFHCYPRTEVMQHFLKGNNVGLVIGRQGQVVGSMPWNLSFITNSITDFNLYYRGGGNTYPLYLYPEINTQQSIESTPNSSKEGELRTPNLNPTIVQQIATKLGLTFVPEKENGNLCFANNNHELRDEYKQNFAPIDLLDYIYAVLHSPTYREKYKEFLKIDFPRVPYPKDSTTFWQLVKLGAELRQIHLLESPVVENFITQYPIDGDNKVVKIHFDNSHPVERLEVVGKVHINNTQYFNNVPQVAWEFYIGGYQPAQKWLKDRKERTLEFDDILQYQKIIVALTATHNMMQKINAIDIEE